MNSATDTQPSPMYTSSASKPLWAAVGILGVAVLAMGGTMIYQQRPQAAAPLPLVAAALPRANVPAASANADDDMVEKPAAAPSKPVTAAALARKVVKPTPRPAPAPSYSTNGSAPAHSAATYPAPVIQACYTCGSIESVTPITRSTKPAGVGVGTVAGGVLGAVLGHQVGQGNGRTLGAIVGAVGGGYAGNAIENNMRKETVYEVGVRMEDGSRRTVELALPPSVGSRVTVEGSTIRSSDGAVYRAPAPVARNAAQGAPTFLNTASN